jgi:zinc/manganese transport system permease protein
VSDAGGLSWNVVADVAQLFAFPFMVNAFLAGTIVAVVAGLIGWFMVLRRQSFAGHTLAVVGFPGAAAATLLGVAPGFGFFGFCLLAALAIAAAGPRSLGGQRGRSQESAVIGTVQAFALACGFLCVSLYRGNIQGVSALLFGTFLGITTTQVIVLGAAGVVIVAVLAAIARPLLFASVDPDVAAAEGVPVVGLGVVFLLLLGTAAAEASQITGSLLIFALLVVPAATAQTLTARPAASVLLTLVIGLAITWLGLALAYYSSAPIGFFITSLAFAAYLLARAARRQIDRAGGPQLGTGARPSVASASLGTASVPGTGRAT